MHLLAAVRLIFKRFKKTNMPLLPNTTKVLQPKEIVNGRLIMCRAQTGGWCGYIIHQSDTIDWYKNKPIYSEFIYKHWKAAMSAGKAAAMEMPTVV